MSIRRQLLTFVIVLCAAGRCWGAPERLSLDGGWLFRLGDVAAPPIRGQA